MNIPEDIKEHIKEYLRLSHILTKDNIVLSYKDMLSYYLSFHPEKIPNFTDFKTILGMIEKYNTYQNDYESNCKYNVNISKPKKELYPLYDKLERGTFTPLLIDILCSGLNLPLANSTFKDFQSFMIDDIKDILRICPTAVLANQGQLRCRFYVDVLYLACINQNIPLSIIKLLIENGADVKYKINFNGYPIHVLEDMEICKNSTWRIEKIKTLFIESI